jgi:glycosyltransferase involved in cell wall biosynthesis
MTKPLVSVLMTSYNREKYVAQSIESVLNSTYTNFELVIVDDCSTDKTVEIIKQYASKDDRIKLNVNAKNLGQFKNRNLVASYATGKYLKYLDSDDFLYPTGLEVLVNMMEQFPDAGYGLSIPQDNSRPSPFILSPEESYRYNYEKYAIFSKSPLASIIKRDAFEKIKGFTVEAVCGDFALWLEMASHFSVVLMPEGIGWYRIHQEQEMQKTRDSLKVAFEYLKAEEMFVSENTNVPSDYKTKLMQQNKVAQLKFCLYALRKLEVKQFFTLFKIHKTDPKKYFHLLS